MGPLPGPAAAPPLPKAGRRATRKVTGQAGLLHDSGERTLTVPPRTAVQATGSPHPPPPASCCHSRAVEEPHRALATKHPQDSVQGGTVTGPRGSKWTSACEKVGVGRSSAGDGAGSWLSEPEQVSLLLCGLHVGSPEPQRNSARGKLSFPLGLVLSSVADRGQATRSPLRGLRLEGQVTRCHSGLCRKAFLFQT